MSNRHSFRWTGDVVGVVSVPVALASATIAAFASSAARASFVYAPIGEPILSASFVLDTAGFTAHRTVLGHEVNTLRLFHADNMGQSFDLSDQLFGLAIWPNVPLVDQGSFGTGWLSATIDPSFFGVLAAGNIGLAGVLTDTGDGYFAIDTMMLQITTASGSFNAPFTASYGSANNGFGIGLADGANLPGPLASLLPPGSTGTGFDETISSKAFGTPTPGAIAVALVAAALLRPHRRRRTDVSGDRRPVRAVGNTALLSTSLLATGALSVGANAAVPNLTGVRALRTHVPVIVNLYPGCNVTPAQAKEAVKAANKIFRRSRAGIEMHVVVDPAPATGGDAGGDGVVKIPNAANGEFEEFLKAGRKEIKEKLAGGKGFKISFVKEVEVQETDGTWTTTDGAAAVGVPVAIVERQSDGEGGYDPAQTGALLAHETYHALGLGPGHRVDPATPGNPGVADSGGHVDPATHPHNVLTPTVTSDSYNLTTSQAAAVRRNRHRVGDCAAQFDKNYPGGALPQQRAAPTSTGGGFADQPGYLTLDDALIASDDGDAAMRCEMLLADPFVGEVDVLYVFAFDSDDDPTTGVEWEGMSGVDNVLELHATGNAGRYDLSAQVRDTSNGSVSPIEGATIEEIVPLSEGDLLHTPIAARLAVELPKALVGLPPELSIMSPSVVPVGLAVLPTGAPAAMTMMEYHLREWMERPSFTTYGNGVPTPGAAYPISIAGLTPNASFDVLVDDRVIFTGTLDGDGGFTGDVPFPADVPAVMAHAIAAQDENGAVAGSVTCPENADQLHAVETPPLEVALDSLPSVTATLEHEFVPLSGLPITFRRLAGGVEFARGERSDDGETSVIFTDDDGRVEMVFAPTSTGLVLVSMSMSDLDFPAYAFFEVVAAPIAVAADLNGDGAVNAADLGLLLGAWGTSGGTNGLGDLDADGVVAASDLAILLGAWTG